MPDEIHGGLAFRGARLAGKPWMQAADQQEVAEASDRLDAALLEDPDKKGVPFGEFFVREDAPLSIMYDVDPGDRMVRVIAVKRI
jgi:hypothetical protein